MFSGSKLRRTNERLDKLDYFEKVDIETVPTDNPSEVDIKVKVKDKNTGSISVGAGYSTSDSVFFGGSIEEKNLFGKGYHAKFQGMVGGTASRYVISFTNPRVYDTYLSAGADLYRLWRAYDSFYKETTGGRVRFSYPLGEYTIASWDYRLETLPDLSPGQLRREHHSGVGGLALVEFRVRSDRPRHRGQRQAADQGYQEPPWAWNTPVTSWVAIPPIVRPGYTSNFFYPMFWDFVFHWRGSASFLFKNANGTIPVSERFYLGGIENVRGYALDVISPKDYSTGERIGGRAQFFTNFETIFPLSKSIGLFGVAFFDAR